MKIVSSEFVLSVAKMSQLPKDKLPQIAFAGRSNVGKSSLLNALLNRKKLALVSKTPGKTRLLNFYLINNAFYFVDLPGYGYAKVKKELTNSWQGLIEGYLSGAQQLKSVVLLVDIRHPISESDLQMLAWLNHFSLRTIIVATKADKLSRHGVILQIAALKKSVQSLHPGSIIPFSTLTGIGNAELWHEIVSYMRS